MLLGNYRCTFSTLKKFLPYTQPDIKFSSLKKRLLVSFANALTLEHAQSLHPRKDARETKPFSTILPLTDNFRTCRPFLAELLKFLN